MLQAGGRNELDGRADLREDYVDVERYKRGRRR